MDRMELVSMNWTFLGLLHSRKETITFWMFFNYSVVVTQRNPRSQRLAKAGRIVARGPAYVVSRATQV